MASEVKRLVDSVERSRAALLHAVDGLREDQGAFRPHDGEWSITENVEHLYLAEMSGLTKMWGAASAYRQGNRWTQELPHRGKSIDQVIAETWKPRETAPPIAMPHIGGPLACWRSATRSLTSVLADLAAQLEGLPLDEVIYPHFLSGPLDMRQRVDFLRFHIDRHLDQIRRVTAHRIFPA